MKPAVACIPAFLAALASILPAAAAAGTAAAVAPALDGIRHFVVIFEENHSFDNLYSDWEDVDGRNGAAIIQRDQTGKAYACLKQIDINLRATAQAMACTNPYEVTPGAFANAPFVIDDFLGPRDTTCPGAGGEGKDGIARGSGLPGGCTRDLVHRFYQEQFQIHGGALDRYVAGSDAAGLTLGRYATRTLPVYAFLHSPGAPAYVIADRFFQGAFGGSFLNHQWLIAAATPQWPGAVNDGGANDLHSVVDANGMPGATPLYAPTPEGGLIDGALTVSCHPPGGHMPAPAGIVCGDFAVNTIQPMAWPFAPRSAASRRLPAQQHATIGDRLEEAGVDWAWYSGGWANAEGDPAQPGYTNGQGPACSDPGAMRGTQWPRCPDRSFQFHHQPFNYFAGYAPGTTRRQRHLRDEEEFLQQLNSSVQDCSLKPVSFVKPLGRENEHPGYASEHTGSDHLVSLLRAWQRSACARDTLLVVTYDEFGGQADHVAPPSSANPIAAHDPWGPGTRIPALVLAPGLTAPFAVDHTPYDTTSILATIERRFGLKPLTTRDQDANDLSHALRASPSPK